MRGWRLFFISIAMLALIAGMTWALFRFATPSRHMGLFIALMVFILAAVIFFTYFVAKPWAFWYAKRRAREYCESGEIKDPEIYERLCRKLDAAGNDPEAADLSDRLKKLKEGK
jgi:hypothetical protein